MAARRFHEAVPADLGEDHRDPGIRVEHAGDDGCETVTHGVHEVFRPFKVVARASGGGQAFFGSARATTTRGRPGCGAVKAACKASWSRPSTVSADQPATSNRAAIPPGSA